LVLDRFASIEIQLKPPSLALQLFGDCDINVKPIELSVPTHKALALAPWSASKVQTALRCARLFHYRYIDKLKEPEVMPETRIGKAVHTALEHALRGMLTSLAIDEGAKELANTDEDDRYRRICQNIELYLQRIAEFRQKRRVGRDFIEYRLAMDVSGQPTGFHSANAFFRGIIDAAYVYDGGAYALVDHKTGLRQPNINIVEQLEGYAVLANTAFFNVRSVRLGVHWVTNAKVDWSESIHPLQIEESLLPKLHDSIKAAALAVSDGPRPQASPACERCSYRSICPQGELVRFEPVDIETDPGLR
jgi:CRISPR/Cas system-associated exonuclease Cas4 (RecB family)